MSQLIPVELEDGKLIDIEATENKSDRKDLDRAYFRDHLQDKG